MLRSIKTQQFAGGTDEAKDMLEDLLRAAFRPKNRDAAKPRVWPSSDRSLVRFWVERQRRSSQTAEIMEYWKGSFAYLHRASAAIDEPNAEEIVKFARTRPGLVVDALLHSFNHFGQIVEYLRMTGIVPAASR
jgi:hypothetical protein